MAHLTALKLCMSFFHVRYAAGLMNFSFLLPITFQISMILPGMITKQKILDSLSPVSQQPYYRVLNLPVSYLIGTEFIEAFVKRGTFQLST